MKDKAAIVIAAIMITSMAFAASTTSVTAPGITVPSTFSASPGASVSPTTTGSNKWVLLSIYVTNDTTREIARIVIHDEADNLWDAPIGGSTGYATNLRDWGVKDNWDNVADNLSSAATYLGRAAENLRRARTALTSAGTELATAAQYLATAANRLNQSDNSAADRASVELAGAATNLANAATAMQADPENLLLVARCLENFAGTGGVDNLAGASGASMGNVLYDNNMENLHGAGENLERHFIGGVAGNQITDADMIEAGRGLENAAACIDNSSSGAYITGWGAGFGGVNDRDNENNMVDNLKNGKFWFAGSYLENAGDEITYVGTHLKAAGVTLNDLAMQDAGEYLRDYVGPKMKSAGTYLKWAADNIAGAGYELSATGPSPARPGGIAASSVQGGIENAENLCMDNNLTELEYMRGVSALIGRAGQGFLGDNITGQGPEGHGSYGGAGPNYPWLSDNTENIFSGADNLVLAAERLAHIGENMTEFGGRYLGSRSDSFDNYLWKAGDNLRDRQRLNLTTAASHLDSAASALVSTKNTLAATAAKFAPAKWALTEPGNGGVVLYAENVQYQLAVGSSENFKFLWKAPATGKTYTLKLWYYDNTNTYRGMDTVSITVDTTVARVVTFRVYQTNGVDNIVGTVRDNGKATIELVASEACSIESNTFIENAGGTQENFLPPIAPSAWTTTDNLTFTYQFEVGAWDDNCPRVRIAVPWSSDVNGNENQASALDNFYTDNRKPVFIENGLNWELFKLPLRTQPGTTNSYRIDNDAEQAILGRVEDNDNTWANLYRATGAGVGPMRFGYDNKNSVVIAITLTYGTSSDTIDLLDNKDFYKKVTLNEGLNSAVTITVTDWAGNSENATIENIFIDTRHPTVTFNTINDVAWTENSQRISDNTPKIKVTITDPGYSATGWGVSSRGSALMYQATTAPGLDNLYVWLDNDDNVRNPLPAAPYGRLENVVAWANDNGVYENIIDNASAVGEGLADGTYWIIVAVNDNLRHGAVDRGYVDNERTHDNWVIAKQSFSIDTTIPAWTTGGLQGGITFYWQETMTQIAAGATTKKTSWYTEGGAQEPGSTIKVYAPDNTTLVSSATASTTLNAATNLYDFTLSFTLSEGVNQVYIEEVDVSNNSSGRILYGTFTVDKTVPTITLTGPTTGTSTTEAQITVSGTIVDKMGTYDGVAYDQLTVTIDCTGSMVQKQVFLNADGSFTTTVPLVEGTNVINVVARDIANITAIAGNQTISSVTVTRTAVPEEAVTPYGTYAIILVIVALILAAIAIFRKR